MYIYKRVREVLDHRTFNQVNKRQSALFAGMPTLLCLCQCMGQGQHNAFLDTPYLPEPCVGESSVKVCVAFLCIL